MGMVCMVNGYPPSEYSRLGPNIVLIPVYNKSSLCSCNYGKDKSKKVDLDFN